VAGVTSAALRRALTDPGEPPVRPLPDRVNELLETLNEPDADNARDVTAGHPTARDGDSPNARWAVGTGAGWPMPETAGRSVAEPGNLSRMRRGRARRERLG